MIGKIMKGTIRLENIFYTYIYLDTRKPGLHKYGEYSFNYEPIYVGKGKNDRWKNHLNYYRNWLGYKIRHIRECGLEPKVEFIVENLDEQSALNLEIELITLIGRRDLGNGPLVNFTEGGEGVSGYMYTVKQKKDVSERLKRYNPMKNPNVAKKVSESLRGKPHTEERKQNQSNSHKGQIPWNKGLKMPEFSKRRRGSNSPNYGKHFSEETRKKMSESNKGLIPWNKGLKLPELSKKMQGMNRSEESKKKQSESMIREKNHFYGKHHNNESKKKQSESMKKLWGNPEYREKIKDNKKKHSERMLGMNNPMYGKHHTELIKKKLSDVSKKLWADPEYRKKVKETRKRNRELRENK